MATCERDAPRVQQLSGLRRKAHRTAETIGDERNTPLTRGLRCRFHGGHTRPRTAGRIAAHRPPSDDERDAAVDVGRSVTISRKSGRVRDVGRKDMLSAGATLGQSDGRREYSWSGAARSGALESVGKRLPLTRIQYGPHYDRRACALNESTPAFARRMRATKS